MPFLRYIVPLVFVASLMPSATAAQSFGSLDGYAQIYAGGSSITTNGDSDFDTATPTHIAGAVRHRIPGFSLIDLQLDLDFRFSSGFSGTSTTTTAANPAMLALNVHGIRQLSQMAHAGLVFGFQYNEISDQSTGSGGTNHFYNVGAEVQLQPGERTLVHVTGGLFDDVIPGDGATTYRHNWFSAVYGNVAVEHMVSDNLIFRGGFFRGLGFIEGDDPSPLTVVSVGGEFVLNGGRSSIIAEYRYGIGGNADEGDRYDQQSLYVGLRIYPNGTSAGDRFASYRPMMPNVASIVTSHVTMSSDFD